MWRRKKEFFDALGSLSHVVVDSVTRLGDFSKFLVTDFNTKVAQIFGDFLKRVTFYVKLLQLLFGHVLGEYWLLLIPKSGHTGRRRRRRPWKNDSLCLSSAASRASSLRKLLFCAGNNLTPSQAKHFSSLCFHFLSSVVVVL